MRILFVVLAWIMTASSPLFSQTAASAQSPSVNLDQILSFVELRPLGNDLDGIKNDFKRYTTNCRNSAEAVKDAVGSVLRREYLEKLREQMVIDCRNQRVARVRLEKIWWGTRNVVYDQESALAKGWTPKQIQDAIKWRTKLDRIYKELSEKYRVCPDDEEVSAILRDSGQ